MIPSAHETRGIRRFARFVAAEAAGGLGDVGTFVPLVLGLVTVAGFHASTVLVFAGLMTIYSGLRFGMPMPVQPMKAIAAIAIAGSLSAQQAAVAGLAVGLCLLLLSAFGLISVIKRLVPEDLVRALQAGLGAMLAVAAVRMVLKTQGANASWLLEGLVPFLVATTALLIFRRRPAWVVVSLLAAGLLMAWFSSATEAPAMAISLWQPRWVLADPSAISGIWLGGVIQLPLTILNAVLAVSLLATQLFPQRQAATTPTKLTLSIALMNLVSCPLGGMPVCHGSGGLAAHYRYGARTGWSLVIFGTGLFLVGLLLGPVAVYWMRVFPSSILAALLVVAGLALIRASRCWSTDRALLSAVVVIVVSHATGTLLAGFVCACLLWPFLPTDLWRRCRGSSRLCCRRESGRPGDETKR